MCINWIAHYTRMWIRHHTVDYDYDYDYDDERMNWLSSGIYRPSPKTARRVKEESRSSQYRVDGPSQNTFCETEQKARASVYCGKLVVVAKHELTPSFGVCLGMSRPFERGRRKVFPGPATFGGPRRRSKILKTVFQVASFWPKICIKYHFRPGWSDGIDVSHTPISTCLQVVRLFLDMRPTCDANLTEVFS